MDTNSSFFIAPLLEINRKYDIYTADHIGVFVGDYQQDPLLQDVGKHILLVYSKVDPKLDEHLTTHQLYTDKYISDTGDIVYRFKLSDEDVATVVKPFLEGKYSKISREYVEKHFPKTSARLAINRKVLDKDPLLRKMWETKIGLELPPDAEVWSKPLMEVEVYGYASSDTELMPSAV